MRKRERAIFEMLLEQINTPEEMEAFCADLLTPKEYSDFLDRISICQELSRGATVQEVCKKLGVASATVVRGNKVLKYGSRFVRQLFQ